MCEVLNRITILLMGISITWYLYIVLGGDIKLLSPIYIMLIVIFLTLLRDKEKEAK